LNLRKALFACIYLFLLVLIPLLLAEVAYRRQWIDTYRAELRAYNPERVLARTTDRPVLLALGDSFTAGRYSYPHYLREAFPRHRVVNSGVSGTGAIQAVILARKRFRQFSPSICIYQLYVGNDLFDIRYPVNFSRIALPRNLYWLVANTFRFVAFVNYRLAQLRQPGTQPAPGPPTPPPPEEPDPFVPERYDRRERLYLKAHPHLLEDQILVAPGRERDYRRLGRELRALHALCRRTSCRLYLLVLPHACQVSPVYLERMKRLGARFSHPERIGQPRYPFLSGLEELFAGEETVYVVNALPALQAAEERGQSVYFALNGHLTPEGQRLVGRLMARAIR